MTSLLIPLISYYLILVWILMAPLDSITKTQKQSIHEHLAWFLQCFLTFVCKIVRSWSIRTGPENFGEGPQFARSVGTLHFNVSKWSINQFKPGTTSLLSWYIFVYYIWKHFFCWKAFIHLTLALHLLKKS